MALNWILNFACCIASSDIQELQNLLLVNVNKTLNHQINKLIFYPKLEEKVSKYGNSYCSSGLLISDCYLCFSDAEGLVTATQFDMEISFEVELKAALFVIRFLHNLSAGM